VLLAIVLVVFAGQAGAELAITLSAEQITAIEASVRKAERPRSGQILGHRCQIHWWSNPGRVRLRQRQEQFWWLYR
jgi:hypothetical protein